jgi:hypothetical protein
MSNSDPKIIINYLHVNCARSFAIYKTLYKYGDDDFFQNNFWRMVANSSQDTAVIQWCNLFGSSNDGNQTHWLNSGVSNISDRDEFVEKILSKIPIAFTDWEGVHKQIVDYRNKNIAHIELDDWKRNVPQFDIAIDALFYSYDVLFPQKIYQNLNLRDEYKRESDATRKIVNRFRLK